LDPGRLLQPTRFPRLPLAPVAEPATLPAPKVNPVEIERCDAAGAARADEPQPLPELLDRTDDRR